MFLVGKKFYIEIYTFNTNLKQNMVFYLLLSKITWGHWSIVLHVGIIVKMNLSSLVL